MAEEALSTEADVEAIKKLKWDIDAAYQASDATLLDDLLTDDIVFSPPNEPEVIGKKAVMAWSETFVENFTVEETSTTFHEIKVLGDWAYFRMDYSWLLAPKPEGETIHLVGKGLIICERQSDGSWRYSRDIWNNNPASSEST